MADSLFVFALILILATKSLNDNAIILVPLLVVAFGNCVVRHINYYNETGRYF
ncbi:MAG TPA: hypothetical protein VL490_08450 [Mucilaginibacter sp.]|nr:hypothetical protein [Mucilaginibacter sp.]